MPARSLPNLKTQRQPTHLKAWRKHRDLSQAKFIEKLAELTGYDISEGQLSRIERGEQPYNQDFMEAAAIVLRCDIADILRIDPTRAQVRYDILDGLDEKQLKRVARIVKAVKDEDDEDRDTGTHG
jgi:transcriptional regulator with XRE-family HTH domain